MQYLVWDEEQESQERVVRLFREALATAIWVTG